VKRFSLYRTLLRLAADERGDSMPEFGISAVVLLMTIFGIMDCSRALYVYHFVSFAAEEGTRYAVVRGSAFSGTACSTTSSFKCDATSAEITSYVQSLAPPGITSTNITVTPSWPGTLPNGTNPNSTCSTSASIDGCLVKVKVSVPFKFVLGFLPGTSMTFAATSENVTQQ
jgi:Flp pilus assembly protein TadG